MSSRLSRWLIAVVVCSGAAAAAMGCGDESPSGGEQALRQAVVDLQRAFQAGDRRGVCDLMGVEARRQAGLVAHGNPDTCEADIGEAFRVIESGGDLKGARGARVVSTSVTDDSASATVDLGGEGAVDVPLVREGGRWRLATFFGTPPDRATSFVAADRTGPFPPADRPVTVNDRSGQPCFPVFSDGYPQIVGGCELHAFANRIEITIDTVFGRFEFGECDLEYQVAVDGKGRTWTHSAVFSGPDNVNNGCSDVDPCESAANESMPWKGRIASTSGGHLIHRMNVCLDTCIGFYAGPLTGDLSNDDGWRATAARAGVGASGLRVDGLIELRGGIEIGA